MTSNRQGDRDAAARVAEMMQRLWSRSRDVFSQRAAEIERSVGAMILGHIRPGELREAERIAHKLAGTLGTYGLTDASDLAKFLELGFGREGETSLVLLNELAAAAMNLSKIIEETDQPPSTTRQSDGDATKQESAAVIVITEDLDYVESLQKLVEGRFDLVHDDCNEITEPPEVVVIDSESLSIGEQLLLCVERVSQKCPGSGIAVVGTDFGLAERISLTELGVNAFVEKKDSTQDLIDVVGEMLVERRENVRRGVVLAVDDDPMFLDTLRAIVEPRVERLATLSSPTKFLETLKDVEPQLLILDYDMPEVDGVQLCRVVRTLPKTKDIAIVMLTASTDPELVQRMYAAGASDCIAKPLTESDLIRRVLPELNRAIFSTIDVNGFGLERPQAKVTLTNQMPSESHSADNQAAIIPDSNSGGKNGGEDEIIDIVVVDDDSLIGELLSESLRMRGYSVTWLEDGQVAVDSLTGQSPLIKSRLILLDVDMPGVNGLSVLRRMKRDGVLANTQVLMLTARASETDTVEAFNLGASDHVAKPFSMPVLFERVRRALSG